MKKFLFICVLLSWAVSFSQQHDEAFKLISTSLGKGVVDTYEKGESRKNFEYRIDSLNVKVPVSYVSIGTKGKLSLIMKVDTSFYSPDSIYFFSEITQKRESGAFQDGKLYLAVYGNVQDQAISVYYKKTLIHRIQVLSVKKRVEKIWIVPLSTGRISADSIQRSLNKIFRPAGISYSVTLKKTFRLKTFPDTRLFRNPSEANERYTREMKYIRDAYLKLHPELKNVHLVFVIPGFNDVGRTRYGVKEKTMYFIQKGFSKLLAQRIASELAGEFTDFSWKKTDANNQRARLNFDIWKQINFKERVYSYFDDYEDIPASTGLVAFYFWKEDALGNIEIPEKGISEPLFFIRRPYKRNTFSYHLQLDDFWVKTIFSIKSVPFNLLHLLGIIGSTWLALFIGIKWRRHIKAKWKLPRLFRLLSLPIIFTGILVANYGLFLLVNLAYSLYEVRSGTIDEFAGKKLAYVQQQIQSNIHPSKLEEKSLSSEMLVQAGANIELRQRDQVLYFEATVGETNKIEKFRCVDAKKTIELPSLDKPIPAQNHYFIITYRKEDGTRLKDEVYNYLGVNVTASLSSKDPIRRILLFVNGYRPTSLGSGFQQHFYDIQKNGFEYPDSYNRLYNFDRYAYWHPWNNIDQRFINVFLPTETYYADGHFSVSTSNYRSIINFSTASTQYPKRCKQGKPHHCFYTSSVKSKFFGARKKKTLNMINYRSNRFGFAERKRNGKVAGRNLYYALNELPNSSKNDTLFVVAHSMGFAYSLGMIEELRGKINFGSFIIIAPENAGAGEVNSKEWKEIWQYGSNLNSKYPDAPCLQDGVAPQVKVKGLPAEKRVFIPIEFYARKGYFDSHFIGYYTWIFDLKKYQKGYITRH